MSTLEVACGRCEKRFRVRAEFAGRSTRCPACSAPITIAGPSRPAPAPRTEAEERPRARPRPRDEGEEPALPSTDWAPVEMAFRREQMAAICVLVGIFLNYLMFCLMRSAGPGGGDGIIGLVILFVAGPDLAAAAFGVMARISALRAPPDSQAKGTAVASLLCALAGLAALVTFTLSLLMGMEANGPGPLPAMVGAVGLMLSVLGAVTTFGGFVAQVGIARRSRAIARSISQAAVAAGVSTIGLVGIGILFTLATEITSPASTHGPQNGVYDAFAQVALGFLFPLAFTVVLILYHRLLAAARRAVQAGLTGRPDE